MRFLYGKQEMRTLQRSQENCFLLTNGLGGYVCLTSAYSVSRSLGAFTAEISSPWSQRLTE